MSPQVIDLAHQLFQIHGLINYSFGFDRAVRRAGQCDFAKRRITLSRHLVENSSIDEIEQVLLHEIAHALAGQAAGHGQAWRSEARRIGYRFERVDWARISQSAQRYVGKCPAGHEHIRMRRPSGPRSCRRCAGSFSYEHVIVWRLERPNQK